MNFRRRIGLRVFQINNVLIGYSRMIESNNRQICSSFQMNGRWMFGSQNPLSTSELFRNVTILRSECFGVFITSPWAREWVW